MGATVITCGRDQRAAADPFFIFFPKREYKQDRTIATSMCVSMGRAVTSDRSGSLQHFALLIQLINY